MLETGSKIDEIRVDGQPEKLRRDLDEFAALGLEAVELPVHGLDAVIHGRLHRGRLEEMKAILWDYGFAYSVHTPNRLNLMDEDNRDLHERVFRSSLEFASEIGAGVAVYHAGRYVSEERFAIPGCLMLSEEERRDLLEREARTLRDLADEFPAVCICIENARPYLYHSPYCYAEQPRALLDQVVRVARPNVLITLDVGHLFLAAGHYGFDPVEEAAAIREFIGHVHVHDNFGLPVYYTEKQQTHLVPFGRGDLHMPVGWGGIPFEAILKTFSGSYDGLLISELRSRYFEYTGESVENLKAVLRNLHT